MWDYLHFTIEFEKVNSTVDETSVWASIWVISIHMAISLKEKKIWMKKSYQNSSSKRCWTHSRILNYCSQDSYIFLFHLKFTFQYEYVTKVLGRPCHFHIIVITDIPIVSLDMIVWYASLSCYSVKFRIWQKYYTPQCRHIAQEKN